MATRRARAPEEGQGLAKRRRPAKGETPPPIVQPSGRSSAAVDPHLASRDPAEFLKRCLAPMEVSTFMSECWAKSAVATHGPPSRFRSLIRHFMHDLELPLLLEDTPTDPVHAWIRRAAPANQTPAASSTASSSSAPASTDAPAQPGRKADPPPLDSIKVDAEAALSLARAGAALYFRAPEELENLLVSGFANALGSSFAGRYAGDGKPRGEIETFVASSGHITGWHTDFQHNFTFQLRGSKTWRFKAGPVENNVRALTPHYKSRSNYEQQMKLHLISDPSCLEFKPPDVFFEDAEEVTLTPGSILYHPAGIWHQVLCNSDDTLSINVSLSCATWGDVIGDAMRQLLWPSALLRAPLVGIAGNLAETKKAAEAALAEVRERAAALTADDLLAPVLVEERKPPKRVNLSNSRLGMALPVRPADRFCFCRLSAIVPLPNKGSRDATTSSSSSSDESSEEVESSGPSSAAASASGRRRVGAGAGKRYALHINFGNEDVASWLRIRLDAPQPLTASLEWLRTQELAARSAEEAKAQSSGHFPKSKTPGLGSFTARELLAVINNSSKNLAKATCWTRTARLLRVLSHCGYLQKVRSPTSTSKRAIRGVHRTTKSTSRPGTMRKVRRNH